MIQKAIGCFTLIAGAFLLLLCAGVLVGGGDGDVAAPPAVPLAERDRPGPPREAVSNVESGGDDPEPNLLSDVPADLKWTAEERERIEGVKRSVLVRLGRRVSEETLRAIGTAIKREEDNAYDKTFIGYLLPRQDEDRGYWATTHFAPTLQVKIIGLTLEGADASLLQVFRDESPSNQGDVLGRWWVDEPGGGVEVISRREGEFFSEFFYGDGSGPRTLPLEPDDTAFDTRFSYVGDDRRETFGDTKWIIKSGGSLLMAEGGDIYARRPPVLWSEVAALTASHPELKGLLANTATLSDGDGLSPVGTAVTAAIRERREATKNRIEEALHSIRDLDDREIAEVFAEIVSLSSANRRVEYLNQMLRVRPNDQTILDAAREARIEQLKESLETALSTEDRLSALQVLSNAEPDVPRWNEERRIALQKRGQEHRAELAAMERAEQRKVQEAAADRSFGLMDERLRSQTGDGPVETGNFNTATTGLIEN